MSHTEKYINKGDKKITEIELGGKLAGLSLSKQIISLALWPFIQNILGTLVSFVDRIIAGNTITMELQGAVFDAMGLAMYVAWLMVIIQGAVATGAQAIVARAFGAKDYNLAQRATGQSIILGAMSGTFSGVVIWFSIPMLTFYFGLEGIAAEYSIQYMQIVAYASPFGGVLLICTACMRAGGDTKTPFFSMVAVNVINIILSLWFMSSLMPPEKMGIAGLAWGTFGGWVVGTIMILCAMVKTKYHTPVVVLKKHLLKWNWSVGKRIVRIGLPQLIEIIGMWFIHAFGVWMVANQLSEDGALGAHGMIVQIESISFMPGFALGMASATLAGQYIGAQSKKGAAHAVRVCWTVAMIAMGGIGICLVVFASELVGIMIPNGGEQADMAIEVIRYVGWVQPFFATALVMKMSMRGAGSTSLVMTLSFGIMLLFRVGVLILAFDYFGNQMTLTIVWIIMMLDLIVQAIAFTVVHFRGKWLDAPI